VAVDLQGTGRNGYWIVRLHEGDEQLAVRVRAASTRLVMVATRPLERGATLREEDVAWEPREVWGPPEAPSSAEPGWTVRRRVRAGEELSPPRVTPPDAVVSGEPVTVEWVGDAVAITLPGKALGTVPVGESVYVRTDTGERLRGLAVAPGRVRVSSNR
jgi:flagella basal body P-ring formation protein FlgA